MTPIARELFIRAFIPDENREHFHRACRVNWFENNAVPTGYFPVLSLVCLPFERFQEDAKRVLFEDKKVTEDTWGRSGGIALSCFAASA